MPFYREVRGLPAAGCRVVVVDDSFDAADSLAMLLRQEGYQVLVAHDGESAVSIVVSCAPEVVLLDIALPDMDGYEVAQRIRETMGGGAPYFIALSGYGHRTALQRSEQAGFRYHLVKPVDISKLAILLRDIAPTLR